jgi:hypothetical protein
MPSGLDHSSQAFPIKLDTIGLCNAKADDIVDFVGVREVRNKRRSSDKPLICVRLQLFLFDIGVLGVLSILATSGSHLDRCRTRRAIQWLNW